MPTTGKANPELVQAAHLTPGAGTCLGFSAASPAATAASPSGACAAFSAALANSAAASRAASLRRSSWRWNSRGSYFLRILRACDQNTGLKVSEWTTFTKHASTPGDRRAYVGHPVLNRVTEATVQHQSLFTGLRCVRGNK